MSTFFDKLEARVEKANSLLCVGLDPHLSELFSDGLLSTTRTEEERCDAAYTFCKTLIDATAPFAACFKPNVAFFEALGPNGGMAVLRRVIKSIPDDIPVLMDVKRGDIGSTAVAYAVASYDHLGADAVTLSPLMGWDSIEPFVTGMVYPAKENRVSCVCLAYVVYRFLLSNAFNVLYILSILGNYSNKGAFLLCKTSNPGSNDVLTLKLASSSTVFEKIAQLAGQWSSSHNASLGLVVGATDPVALQRARQACGEHVWILAPGVGAQGGNLAEAVAAGMNSAGKGMLIPVSRGISRADDPAAAAKALQEQINAERVKNQQEPVQDIQAYQRDFLEFSLAQGVLKFGSFVLKSGRTSPYFFNAGLFSSGSSLHKLGKAYASAIMASPAL